jgi:hypothetical protein
MGTLEETRCSCRQLDRRFIELSASQPASGKEVVIMSRKRSRSRQDLVGSSELPGRWYAPIEGGGRADQLRSSLSLLGVPFENLVTQDADKASVVELGTTAGSS